MPKIENCNWPAPVEVKVSAVRFPSGAISVLDVTVAPVFAQLSLLKSSE